MDWAASPDRKYLYYTTGGAEPKAMRIRLADRKTEEIASLKGLRRALDPILAGTQMSVAPDGSPVFTRDIGSQEIYALTIKWPSATRKLASANMYQRKSSSSRASYQGTASQLAENYASVF